MEKTLRQGDHFVVDITSRRVGRRDVVVFLRDGTYFVKRAIAINGDSIQGKDGAVFVNGTEQDEPYVEHIGGRGGQEDWMNIFGPITIPQGKCFVMGDNRDVSLDSRSTELGLADESSIIGKPLYIFGSDRPGKNIR
jgi:signal peptidase I